MCVKIGIKGSPNVEKSLDIVSNYLGELEEQDLYIVSIYELNWLYLLQRAHLRFKLLAGTIGVNIYEVPCTTFICDIDTAFLFTEHILKYINKNPTLTSPLIT